MSTASYSKGDIVLLPYPFTNLTTSKVRPAVVVAAEDGRYPDVFVVPITSRTGNLTEGEFLIADWKGAGLNVPSVIKRGCVLVDTSLFRLKVGGLSRDDVERLESALKLWLELDRL